MLFKPLAIRKLNPLSFNSNSAMEDVSHMFVSRVSTSCKFGISWLAKLEGFISSEPVSDLVMVRVSGNALQHGRKAFWDECDITKLEY